MSSIFKSTTRMKGHVLLILCLILVIGNSAFAATAAINPATYCAPGQAINSRQCAARIRKCRAYGAIMKFTGKGCRNPRGKPARDGGCQCSGYCAYSCSKPCVRDRQCYWNATAAACFVKATNTIGAPIPSCLPTHTTQPSQQPAIPTAMPSMSPVKSPSANPSTSPSTSQPSSSPSASPTTSEPSMSPSQSPSQTPSQTPSTTPTTGPVLVTCDLTTEDEVTGIWLDGVDLLSSVTPSGTSNLNNWEVAKQITFEVDPLSTSQTIAMSGRSLETTSSKANSGFTFICQSELLVWTFQTSIYENWVGVNGPTFPANWEIGSGAAVGTLQSTSGYCLNIAPYNQDCDPVADKYDIVKIWPFVVSGSGDPLQGIRKTIDSSTPNYMMEFGRMVLMPPSAGSTVILYSISNTKSFRIVNTGTAGNLCIYDEQAEIITRCYYLVSSSTLFFFAFAGPSAAGYDNTVPPGAPGIVETALFTSVTSTGIIYLRDDEYLCYNDAGELPPTSATACLLFSSD